MFKRKPAADLNLLELTPVRCWSSETNDDGIVTVDMPRFHVAWMQRFLVPMRKYPYIRIKLDLFGSHAWERIDGASTVTDIADALLAQFGEEVEPVYERIGVFFRQLHDRGFVKLRTQTGELV